MQRRCSAPAAHGAWQDVDVFDAEASTSRHESSGHERRRSPHGKSLRSPRATSRSIEAAPPHAMQPVSSAPTSAAEENKAVEAQPQKDARTLQREAVWEHTRRFLSHVITLMVDELLSLALSAMSKWSAQHTAAALGAKLGATVGAAAVPAT